MSTTTTHPDVPWRAPAAVPAAQAASSVRRPSPSTSLARFGTCRCGQPVHFDESCCAACDAPLGYDPERGELMALLRVDDAEPARQALAIGWAGSWRLHGTPGSAPRYGRCANLGGAVACNWLVPEADLRPGVAALCRCCRLVRTGPEVSAPEHAHWWSLVEQARRRLVASLIGLGLPVRSRLSEDPDRGLAFDVLRAGPGETLVPAGHADGIVTIDLEEADDAWRAQRRATFGEPFRTLLGQLRHDTGHYYWHRLVEGSPWHEPWRDVFGDERLPYTTALQRHHLTGAPAGWEDRYVNSQASSHPSEDWAETWAHYLHLRDALDAARGFGLDGPCPDLPCERFRPTQVAEPGDPQVREFVQMLNHRIELTAVVHELTRGLSVADFRPLPPPLPVAVVRKLYFVHRVIAGARTPA